MCKTDKKASPVHLVGEMKDVHNAPWATERAPGPDCGNQARHPTGKMLARETGSLPEGHTADELMTSSQWTSGKMKAT